MNITKYIHDLLLENELVIIPGFGAFVSNYKSAEIDEHTKEIKPPSKEISFNQQIRNNDGLLVGKVAEGEMISHFDALKKIEVERENIIFQLDKGEKVVFDEIGSLSYNEKDEIEFEPYLDENLLLDSFGLENVSFQENEGTAEEEIVAENVESTEVVKDEKASDMEEPAIVEEVNEENESEKSFQPKNMEPVLAEDDKSESSQEKKKGWLWFLLILIPIAIVGLYLMNEQREEKGLSEKVSNEITSVEEKPAVIADSIATDTTSSVLPDSTAVVTIDSTVTETTVEVLAKFVLVGGSFKEEENAENFLKELKDKGFEPFHLGKKGSFYIVGIGKYETEKDASIAKQKFNDENPNSGVWIYEEKDK